MRYALITATALLVCAGLVQADSFGTGANQFDIDFVTISGATNPSSGQGIVDDSYRMGVYEVTNGQWDKFCALAGTPTGNPIDAYNGSAYWPGADVATNDVSWYEAARFVNWLNESEGHQGAYKFVGSGSNTTFSLWAATDGDRYDPDNPYRNPNAVYFLPTIDEWTKAAYWNGTALQLYATPNDIEPVVGTDVNIDDVYGSPWDVGNGSVELNGTFDMMGNVWERLETPDGSYTATGRRRLRGGAYDAGLAHLQSTYDGSYYHSELPYGENKRVGFRVASQVPEPATLGMLALGGLALLRRRRRK